MYYYCCACTQPPPHIYKHTPGSALAHPCSKLNVGISEGCFIFDFTSLPMVVTLPLAYHVHKSGCKTPIITHTHTHTNTHTQRGTVMYEYWLQLLGQLYFLIGFH